MVWAHVRQVTFCAPAATGLPWSFAILNRISFFDIPLLLPLLVRGLRRGGTAYLGVHDSTWRERVKRTAAYMQYAKNM